MHGLSICTSVEILCQACCHGNHGIHTHVCVVLCVYNNSSKIDFKRTVNVISDVLKIMPADCFAEGMPAIHMECMTCELCHL